MPELMGLSPEAIAIIGALVVVGGAIVITIIVMVGRLVRATNHQTTTINSIENLRRQDEEKRFSPEALASHARRLAQFAENFADNPRLAVNARLAGALLVMERRQTLLERVGEAHDVAAAALKTFENNRTNDTRQAEYWDTRVKQARRHVQELGEMLECFNGDYGKAVDAFDELASKVTQFLRQQ